VVGQTNIFDGHACGAADLVVRDDSVQRSAKLMGRTSSMQQQPVAVDEQTKLNRMMGIMINGREKLVVQLVIITRIMSTSLEMLISV